MSRHPRSPRVLQAIGEDITVSIDKVAQSASVVWIKSFVECYLFHCGSISVFQFPAAVLGTSLIAVSCLSSGNALFCSVGCGIHVTSVASGIFDRVTEGSNYRFQIS